MRESSNDYTKFEGFIKNVRFGREYIKKDHIYIVDGEQYHPTWRFMEVSGIFYSHPWWVKCKITFKKDISKNEVWQYKDFCIWNKEKARYESVLNMFSYLLLDPIQVSVFKQLKESETA